MKGNYIGVTSATTAGRQVIAVLAGSPEPKQVLKCRESVQEASFPMSVHYLWMRLGPKPYVLTQPELKGYNEWQTHTSPEGRLEVLQRLYTLKNAKEVAHFLVDCPFLVPLLEEVPKKLQAYFPNSPITLDVSQDPDEDEGVSYLVASILTKVSPKEAFEAMKRFDYDWWLDVPYQVREKLLITVGF